MATCSHCGGSGEEPGTALVRLPGILPAPRTHTDLVANVQAFEMVRARADRRLTLKVLREARAELVFSYWQIVHAHERSRYDANGRGRLLIRAQEQNDDDVSELLFVNDGALKDSRLMGQRNDSDRKYDGIETLYRDRAMIERLSEMGGYRGDPHPIALKYPALCLNANGQAALL